MRARRHDHDAVRQRDRLLEVVGNEQHRLAIGAPQLQQQIAHDLPGLGIERAERLVHQQDLGIADQHLGQPDALALPARQHMRIAVAERRKTHRREPGLRAFQRALARHARYLQANGDIVDRGLPGKQRIGLEEIAGITVQPGQWLVEDLDRSGGWLQKPGGDVEQRGFSASRRADDGDELAMGHGKTGPLYRCVDAIPGHAKRHRRLVKRDRRWLCGIRHASSPRLE